MGRQVVSSRCRLVREVRFPCRSGGSAGWLSYGFSLVRTSKSRLPPWRDNTEFMKTALAVLALAAMAGCATRTPAAPAPAASHADGSRRSVVRADTIDPVAVAARWLNWRHRPSGVGRGSILQFAGR